MTFAVPARERPKPRTAPDIDRLAARVEVRTQTIAAALAKRGIHTAGDLLETPPRAWRDYSEGVTALGDVVVGAEATVRVELISVHVRPTRRRNLRIVEAAVRDDSGAGDGDLVQPGLPRAHAAAGPAAAAARHRARRARPRAGGARARGAGRGRGGAAHERHGGRLRRLAHALDARPARARRAAPAAQRRDRRPAAGRACASAAACRCVATRSPRCTRPPRRSDAKIASDRLAYEELLLLQVALAERRAEAPAAEPLGRPGELLQRYHDSLPFTLTIGQKRSIRDIDRDLARGGRAMHRLLLGDVGSGKTVVAVHAMLRAAERGRQAALAGARPRCSCSSTRRPCAAWWSRSASSWR